MDATSDPQATATKIRMTVSNENRLMLPPNEFGIIHVPTSPHPSKMSQAKNDSVKLSVLRAILDVKLGRDLGQFFLNYDGKLASGFGEISTI